MSALLAVADTASTTDKLGWPLMVAILTALGATIAATVSFALAKLGDAAARRRAGYAEAVSTLVAWAEYPYRIRRRTSDDPAVLAALVEKGHELQERMRCVETWILCDSRRVGKVWREVRAGLAPEVGEACKDSWGQPPAATAAAMNLGAWGPSGVDAQLLRLEQAAKWRFGWRRFTPGFKFSSIAKGV